MLQKPFRILCFCAHPDDLEFYIGHLLTGLTHPQMNLNALSYIFKTPRLWATPDACQIRVVSMTRGEMSGLTRLTQSTKKSASIRTAELKNSLKKLNISNLDFLGFIDGFVKVSDQAIRIVQSYLEGHPVDVIIAPEPVYTYYLHQDHIKTGKIVYYAVQRMIKQQNAMNNRYFKIPRIYYYPGLFNHVYFPRLSVYSPYVKNAVKCHKSQTLILTVGRIPVAFFNLIHGLKIRESLIAEALRRQFIPGLDNPDKRQLLYRGFNGFKRFLYYVSWALMGSSTHMSYKTLKKYIDGTLPPKTS